MRWLFGGLAAILFLVPVYFGSAAMSLAGLVAAARAGDGAAVLQRTDMRALNASLANQIVSAYLARIGQKREVRPTEKMLINAFGSGIADAMIRKLLTAENLTKMLKTGQLDAAPGLPPVTGLPALGDVDAADVAALLGRVRLVNPVLLSVRISNGSDPASFTAIDLHFEDLGWKLAGITLPASVVRDLAASLPIK